MVRVLILALGRNPSGKRSRRIEVGRVLPSPKSWGATYERASCSACRPVVAGLGPASPVSPRPDALRGGRRGGAGSVPPHAPSAAGVARSRQTQGWVYRIARNVIIDHYRARHDQQPLEEEAGVRGSLGARRRRPLASATALHSRLALPVPRTAAASISKASPWRRSQALGLTLTAAKSRVRRARLLLRGMLDQCCRFAIRPPGPRHEGRAPAGL